MPQDSDHYLLESETGEQGTGVKQDGSPVEVANRKLEPMQTLPGGDEALKIVDDYMVSEDEGIRKRAKQKLINGKLSANLDVDGDGFITDKDLEYREQITQLQMLVRKQQSQKHMAWVAILSTIAFTVLLFSPAVSVERVAALSDLIGLFYIAMAGIVASFFGSAAYMTHKSS